MLSLRYLLLDKMAETKQQSTKLQTNITHLQQETTKPTLALCPSLLGNATLMITLQMGGIPLVRTSGLTVTPSTLASSSVTPATFGKNETYATSD